MTSNYDLIKQSFIDELECTYITKGFYTIIDFVPPQVPVLASEVNPQITVRCDFDNGQKSYEETWDLQFLAKLNEYAVKAEIWRFIKSIGQ